MENIQSFEEFSINEGILDILKKRKKESASNVRHMNGWITLPVWGDEEDVRFEASNIFPKNDEVEFVINDGDVTRIIFIDKDPENPIAKVNHGSLKTTEVDIDQQEADRIREKYLK